MKRNKLIIAITAAALTLSAVPSAFAQDYRGRDGGGRGGHDHDHGHDHRRERYIVHYHMDGERTLHAGSHFEAHRLVSFLQSVGAEAHIDGSHVVHFHMHGNRRIERYSHGEAHRFASALNSYGFHAHVDHE